ncbi:hypothetical protein AWB69_05797 [Caballeronia udeis]|uniref:Uncharacterized protein n=1 Tax=Caballeronia udeis TaxID=1232866 RepID=A0A158ID39_9BURK|nr:hypothetical protein AWB69_05797 [Caballeronia udeis]
MRMVQAQPVSFPQHTSNSDGVLESGLAELHRLASAQGHELVESLSTMAQSSGRTVQ